MTVANKPGHRGEHEGNRKTIAQGKPDDPATPVVLPPCFFCTGPTGATGTRLSLRPLMKRAASTDKASRETRGEIAKLCLRHCEEQSDEAIQLSLRGRQSWIASHRSQ
jgi:hypothetical protein